MSNNFNDPRDIFYLNVKGQFNVRRQLFRSILSLSWSTYWRTRQGFFSNSHRTIIYVLKLSSIYFYLRYFFLQDLVSQCISIYIHSIYFSFRNQPYGYVFRQDKRMSDHLGIIFCCVNVEMNSHSLFLIHY